MTTLLYMSDVISSWYCDLFSINVCGRFKTVDIYVICPPFLIGCYIYYVPALI
jgi:hypothetical protein